jgi:Flp pilus assembly protein TadG
MIRIPTWHLRMAADTKGISTIEFALSVPVLLILLLATVDVSRFAFAHLKIFNAASSLADLASRDETLSAARISDLFGAAQHIVRPFEMGNDGRIILTGISADVANDPRVFWQVAGGGSMSATSQIGATGGPAALPPSLTIDVQETVIAAEVIYNYHPIFALPIADPVIRQTAYFRPRLGSLRTLE